MPDRVKEALFDILGSRKRTPGALPEALVIDLFAGSGSLGLEAMSRGASGCLFVERNRQVLGVLRANLQSLACGAEARVVVADAWSFRCDQAAIGADRAEIVFVDPPYVDSRDTSSAGAIARLLGRLGTAALLSPSATVVFHHERRIEYVDEHIAPWVVVDRRNYGSTAICFLERSHAQAGPPAADNALSVKPTPDAS